MVPVKFQFNPVKLCIFNVVLSKLLNEKVITPTGNNYLIHLYVDRSKQQMYHIIIFKYNCQPTDKMNLKTILFLLLGLQCTEATTTRFYQVSQSFTQLLVSDSVVQLTCDLRDRRQKIVHNQLSCTFYFGYFDFNIGSY